MKIQRIILAVLVGALMSLCYVVTDSPLQFSLKKIVIGLAVGTMFTIGMLRYPQHITSPSGLVGYAVLFSALCVHIQFTSTRETLQATMVWSLALLTLLSLRAILEHRHKIKSARKPPHSPHTHSIP